MSLALFDNMWTPMADIEGWKPVTDSDGWTQMKESDVEDCWECWIPNDEEEDSKEDDGVKASKNNDTRGDKSNQSSNITETSHTISTDRCLEVSPEQRTPLSQRQPFIKAVGTPPRRISQGVQHAITENNKCDMPVPACWLSDIEYENDDSHWRSELDLELENITVDDNLEFQPVTKNLMKVLKRRKNGTPQPSERHVRHSKHGGHGKTYRYARLRFCKHFWKVQSSEM